MSKLVHALASLVERKPGLLLAVIVVATIVFAGAATQTTQEQGFENFSPSGDIAQASETIREQFSGGVTSVQILVEHDRPVLSPEGVLAAQTIRERITADENLNRLLQSERPQIGVVTYADLVLTIAAEEQLDVTDFATTELVGFHTMVGRSLPPNIRAQTHLLLAGSGESSFAREGLVLATFETENGDDLPRQVIDAIGDIEGVQKVTVVDFEAFSEQVGEEIERELSTLLIVAFTLIVAILAFLYRNIFDVVISVAGLVFTIIWMQGIAAILGPNVLGIAGGMSEMALIIPILLVGLGVDYSLHLTMRYREERNVGKPSSQAASAAVKAVGVALALATITTAVGFLTNVTNPLPPLQDFGMFAAAGVISAFLIMSTMIPAARALKERRSGRAQEPVKPSPLGNVVAKFAPVAVNRPWYVLFVAAALTVAGALSATNLSTEFSQTEFFPAGSEALELIETLEASFGGDLTERTQILIQGDVENSREDIKDFEQTVSMFPEVRRFGGEPDIESANVRAERNGLSGTYAELREQNPDVFASTISEQGDLLVTFGTSAGDETDVFVEDIRTAAVTLESAGLTVTTVSDSIVVDEVLSQLTNSQVNGLIYTLVVSMFVLVVAFWFRSREPELGVLSIVSVAIVVAWSLGVMAATGIPFNVMTAMVSALAVGIGVPFGIHVVNRFSEDREKYDGMLEAMQATLQNTGGALAGSALTTVAGFGTLALSSVTAFRQLGIVISMTIFFAMVASIAVLPAMLAIKEKRHGKRKSRR